MTKIEISPADIRKGDLIRFELDSTVFSYNAIEYVSTTDNQAWNGSLHGKHFLLDRPEQPFKVGTVLKGPSSGINLYIRGGDGWYIVPRTSDAFDPRKAEFSDKGARERIEQGDVKILSEPA